MECLVCLTYTIHSADARATAKMRSAGKLAQSPLCTRLRVTGAIENRSATVAQPGNESAATAGRQERRERAEAGDGAALQVFTCETVFYAVTTAGLAGPLLLRHILPEARLG